MAKFIGIDLWTGEEVNHGLSTTQNPIPESFRYMVSEDITIRGMPRIGRRTALPEEIIHYFQYSPNGTPLREQVPGLAGPGITDDHANYFSQTMPFSVPSKSPQITDALNAIGHTDWTLTTENVDYSVERLFEKGPWGQLGQALTRYNRYLPEGWRGDPDINVPFRPNLEATPAEKEEAKRQGMGPGPAASEMGFTQGPMPGGIIPPSELEAYLARPTSTTEVVPDPSLGATPDVITRMEEFRIKEAEKIPGTPEYNKKKIADLKAAAEPGQPSTAAPAVTGDLTPAEFQAAWAATIANNGEIPPQYLKFTPSTTETRNIAGRDVTVAVAGQPHPQTTALLNLRGQIIGMGIQQRGEEFQQQEFTEQQRRAGVAEQQALAGLTGRMTGTDQITGYDAQGEPIYQYVPGQETLQSLIQRANITGQLGEEPTLAQRQFNLDRLLQTAGLTGELSAVEGEDPARTLAAQQLDLERQRLFGMTPKGLERTAAGLTPGAETQTLAQRQFELERARAAGLVPGLGPLSVPSLESQQLDLERQRLYGAEGTPAAGAPTLPGQQLGLETARLFGRQGTPVTGAATLQASQFDVTQQMQEELARQSLEAQQARAALEAVTGMSQAAMQSPYGFGAFRALGGLGGGAGTAQQQITQQLAPIGFQFPTEARAGAQVSPQAYFPSGVPTLGSLSQLPSSGREQLQAVLGMTGTSPGQFGRLAGSITPTVTPQEQRTVRRRKPQVTGATI